MKPAAWAIFGIGVMVGISGAAKMPAEGSDWPDTWWISVVGAVLAAVGVVVWRLSIKQEIAERIKEEEKGTLETKTAAQLLEEAMAPAEKLRDAIGGLDAEAIQRDIDEILEGYILPFAEVRRSMIDRFGMSKGAEILVTVAYGERMLNRVWSAASDGHLPEARASMPEAFDALQEAQKMVKAAAA